MCIHIWIITEIIKASFFIFEGEFVMKTLIKESIFGVAAILNRYSSRDLCMPEVLLNSQFFFSLKYIVYLLPSYCDE